MAEESLRHTAFEDAQAIITGALIVSIGVAMHKQAGLLTGGITGLAFLLHYTCRAQAQGQLLPPEQFLSTPPADGGRCPSCLRWN